MTLFGQRVLAPCGAARYHPAMYMRFLPAGFVPPCLPTKALEPPSGEAWLHEIKHDGFRVIARKEGNRVRRYRRHDASVFLYVFDLIELNGDDLRREPLDTRKAARAAARADAAHRCAHG